VKRRCLTGKAPAAGRRGRAQYIIGPMCVRRRLLAAIAGVAALAAACSNPLARQYEYSEQLYLDVDGSAELVIDSSIPAFVAFRNLPLDPSPDTPVDRDAVARAFSHPDCGRVTVNRPWRRHGRRFVQVVLRQDDVRRFAGCPPVAWSSYSFERREDGERAEIHYVQEVGPPDAGDPGPVNWTGEEVVGFKLHLPSRILYHNVRRLEDGLPGNAERGNILAWEQWLEDRRAGTPIRMEVRMDAQSILYRTLWLFAGAFAAAVLTLASATWFVLRRARRRIAASRQAVAPRPRST
jgi:hypothetical protein